LQLIKVNVFDIRQNEFFRLGQLLVASLVVVLLLRARRRMIQDHFLEIANFNHLFALLALVVLLGFVIYLVQ